MIENVILRRWNSENDKIMLQKYSKSFVIVYGPLLIVD